MMAASGDGSSSPGALAAPPAGAPARACGTLPTIRDIGLDGPFSVLVDSAADGGAGWLFMPSELGEAGMKHPVFVWGCGAGSLPSAYMFHLSRLASHGFVVYAAASPSVTGAMLTSGIDYLFAECSRSGSPLDRKLDLTKVGVGGHSLGSLRTYEIAADARITTTVHVDGGSFDGQGWARLRKPTLFICGEDSTGTPNSNIDYERALVPIFYTRISGLRGLHGHIMAARHGIDVWLAWLRWQLGGEEERRADFLEPMCTYRIGKWDSQSKNW